MQARNTQRGITLMMSAVIVFALQDGFSRHLAETYNTPLVVMIRYWFFALFVLAIANRRGGIRATARSKQLPLQIFRGILLVVEILVMVTAFIYLGLGESMAIFATVPLLVAALSGPILGEPVGLRRWIAIGFGFLGLLVILRPGFGVFSPYALIALTSALLFALYTLLTRFVARDDDAMTSFFWTGIAGVVTATLAGMWFWEPMTPRGYGMMAMLCVMGALGHFLLIKCYEAAEASAVQPFAYFHLVFATFIGWLVFAEELRATTLIGAGIVVAAGLYTWWRERVLTERASQN